MTAKSAITYEITASVRDDLTAAYETYMRDRHIPDVLRAGAFARASFSRSAPGRYRIRYEARGRAELDAYLSTHARDLRAHFMDAFPEGVELTREEWTVLESWDDRAP